MKAELNLSILLILAQVSFCKNNPVISSSLLRWETGLPTEMGTRRRSTRLRRLSWWYMYWVRLESSWVLVGWLFGSCWSILLKCKEWIFFFLFYPPCTLSLAFSLVLNILIYLLPNLFAPPIYFSDIGNNIYMYIQTRLFYFLKLRYAVTVTVHLLEFT